MAQLIDLILHIDQHLKIWVENYGLWIYLILFLIIFCETGLIVTPFLPGDSLLFAAGSLTVLSVGSGYEGLNIWYLSGLLIIAAFVGDQVNYFIGRSSGEYILKRWNNRFVNRKNLNESQVFLNKHGPLGIILARFAPMVRTFVPFAAGLGQMERKLFVTYNFLGAVIWIQIFLWLGHFFGQVPAVQKNFSLVIAGIIVVSILPFVWGLFKARHRLRAQFTDPTREP